MLVFKHLTFYVFLKKKKRKKEGRKDGRKEGKKEGSLEGRKMGRRKKYVNFPYFNASSITAKSNT